MRCTSLMKNTCIQHFFGLAEDPLRRVNELSSTARRKQDRSNLSLAQMVPWPELALGPEPTTLVLEAADHPFQVLLLFVNQTHLHIPSLIVYLQASVVILQYSTTFTNKILSSNTSGFNSSIIPGRCG